MRTQIIAVRLSPLGRIRVFVTGRYRRFWRGCLPMRFICFFLKPRGNLLGFVYNRLEAKFLTPEHHIAGSWIEVPKFVHIVDASHHVFGAEKQVCVVVVGRFSPPPVKAFIEVLEIVAHRHIP
jgi:hypothetical protein